MSLHLCSISVIDYIKRSDVKAFMCLYLPVLLPSGAEKSIN